MSKNQLHYETVIYYQDYETDARWAACRELMLRSGMDAVTFYSIREHELRHFSLEVIEPRIERMGRCAAELAAEGIETAGALLPALGWGQVIEEGPFEKIVGPDGTRSGTGSCPLDPNLRKHLAAHAAMLGRAGFAAMSIEDDFQTENHRPVRGGCLCPRHLKAFSESEGRTWDRESLIAALANDGKLKQRWDACKVTILGELAAELQAASGGLPICLLGGMDAARLPHLIFDRVKTHYFRPGQGYYEDSQSRYAPMEAAWRGIVSHLEHSHPRHIPAAAEITTWPRNAYVKSWSTCMLQSALSAFGGLDILLYWAGHGPRDAGFERAVTTDRGLRELLRQCCDTHPHVRGLYAPALSPMAMALARMGLPLTWDEANADATLGQEIVDCQSADLPMSPAAFYAGELLTDDALNGDDAGWPSTCLTLLREGDFQRITVEGEKRVLSHFMDNDSQPVADAVVIHDGRVIFNHTPMMWDKLISPVKARQARRAIEGVMGQPLPVVAVDAPEVFVFARDAVDGSSRVVLVMNLSLDAAEGWSLIVDRDAKATFVADGDGAWHTCDGFAPLPPRAMRVYRFVF